MTTTGSPPGLSSTTPTLDEVARLAGVSRATASRAINGGSRVSPAAQAAVDAAVRRLRYIPNRAARSLVTRRTDSVAVVVPEPDERVFSDPFFPRVLRGVGRVLAEQDLQMVLLLARPDGDGAARTLRYLGKGHVDGALVTSFHRDDGIAEQLADLGLPCVFAGRPWAPERVSYVDVDNVAGAQTATQVLIERGCRRIVTIAGPPDMTASQDRLAGWRTAVRAAGLRDDGVAHGDFTETGGRAAAHRLLTDHPDLDGIVAASDLMAAGALSALEEAGRRVPHDVAVIGYDDLGVAERTSPALTTMRQEVVEVAERATRLLLEQIDAGRPGHPARLIIPSRLVRRESA